MRMTSSCRIAALVAAFFLSHSAASQEEDLPLPVPAPAQDVAPVASRIPQISSGGSHAAKFRPDSRLSHSFDVNPVRCGRGVYSDNCRIALDARAPRDVSTLFPDPEVWDCRGVLRPGFECVRHVRR